MFSIHVLFTLTLDTSYMLQIPFNTPHAQNYVTLPTRRTVPLSNNYSNNMHQTIFH